MKTALTLLGLALTTQAHAAILLTAQSGPYRAQLTHTYDPEPAEEDCYDVATLTVWKTAEEGGQTQTGRHALCNGANLTAINDGDHTEFLIAKPGDGSDGAGLYRYVPETDTLAFEDFGARHVVVEGLSGTTLTVHTQNRTPDSGRSQGKNPDTLHTYHWPLGEKPQEAE